MVNHTLIALHTVPQEVTDSHRYSLPHLQCVSSWLRLEFPLVVEREEEEEVVEEVTLLFEDRSQHSMMVVEQEAVVQGVLEIFPSQQRHHPASL